MNTQSKIAAFALLTIVITCAACYFTFKAAYTIGWESRQVFEVEKHPVFINMKETMELYADRNQWTGLFGRIWWGDGSGYTPAEKVLGIERDDEDWIPFLKNEQGFYPCPFCGSTEVELLGKGVLRKQETVECQNCGAYAHKGVWNVRN